MMARYYFDMRDGKDLTADEEGMDLGAIAAVEEEAAFSLADMARGSVRKYRSDTGHAMAIEVRDDNGPVLQAKFTFEISRQRR
jgi:hypothetical protein